MILPCIINNIRRAQESGSRVEGAEGLRHTHLFGLKASQCEAVGQRPSKLSVQGLDLSALERGHTICARHAPHAHASEAWATCMDKSGVGRTHVQERHGPHAHAREAGATCMCKSSVGHNATCVCKGGMGRTHMQARRGPHAYAREAWATCMCKGGVGRMLCACPLTFALHVVLIHSQNKQAAFPCCGADALKRS